MTKWRGKVDTNKYGNPAAVHVPRWSSLELRIYHKTPSNYVRLIGGNMYCLMRSGCNEDPPKFRILSPLHLLMGQQPHSRVLIARRLINYQPIKCRTYWWMRSGWIDKRSHIGDVRIITWLCGPRMSRNVNLVPCTTARSICFR